MPTGLRAHPPPEPPPLRRRRAPFPAYNVATFNNEGQRERFLLALYRAAAIFDLEAEKQKEVDN
jgi:hypothetical protein